MAVPQQETRTVLQNLLRTVLSLVFAALVAGLYLASVVDQSPISVELSQIEHTFIWTVFVLYVVSGGFHIFGKSLILDAFELIQNVRGGSD